VGMLNRLIHRIGKGTHCRNTRLEIEVDRGWLVVRMVDKCTSASYEATYSPETAARLMDTLGAKVDLIRQP
jgi:hypothetical protein